MMIYPIVSYKMVQNDITQQELAYRIGMDRPLMHRKLSGKRPFNDYEKQVIRKALDCEDVPMDVLFATREQSHKIESMVQTLIDTLYKKLIS